MTIGNPASSTGPLPGNGVTTSWSFQFLIPTTASCVLQILDTSVDPEVLTTVAQGDFTIAGTGNTAGGSITYPLSGSPVSSGQFLTAYRVLDLTQTASIANSGNMAPEMIENALDYQMMIAQQLQTAVTALEDAVDGGIIPLGIPTTDSTFGTVIATTASIDDLEATTASIGTLTVEGLLLDTSFTTTSVTSGQTLTLSGAVNFTALSMTQTAAALTIYLPTSPIDGQSAGFSIDQNVTALSVTASHTVKNVPATTSAQFAGATFEWTYDAGATVWYRRQNSGVGPISTLTGSGNINFGTVLTARSSTGSVTVAGAVFGDYCEVESTGALLGGFLVGQAVTGSVIVFFCNLTGATVTTGTLSCLVTVFPKSQFGQ